MRVCRLLIWFQRLSCRLLIWFQTTCVQIVNLVSNDVRRFDDTGPFWVFLICGPVELIAVLVLVGLRLGFPAAVAGVSALLLLIPTQVGSVVGRRRGGWGASFLSTACCGLGLCFKFELNGITGLMAADSCPPCPHATHRHNKHCVVGSRRRYL